MLRRALVWGGAAVLCALVAVGCGGGGAEGGGGEEGRYREEIVIGWTPPDITGVFKTATDFFEQAAQDANKEGFNVRIESRSPETHTAFADQLEIIENFISQNVDVIAVSPSDTEAIKPAIQRANEAGIPVIMVNLLEPQDDIEVASYIGFDNSEAASVSAYSVLDYYGGPGVLGAGEKVDVPQDQYLDLEWWEKTYENADASQIQASGVIIEGIAGTFFSQERLDGFNQVMDEYDGIEILGEPIAADWNREKGVQAAEDFMSRYSPEEMNFMWAASNEMGLGAMAATQRRGVLDDSGGKTPPAQGKVAIFTNDVTPESTDAIREGKIIAETHHGFPEWGWFGTKFGVQLACGQDVPQTYDIRPRTVWQGNADLFYPNPDLPEINWQQIKNDC
ncbi:MAG TPA: sugar ABC transporter substrate-binding protein [Rubrobacter sp.]|jgi:ribose transport system substrate-binding protein|nr:sugar ABC transporter substrate-binding protein [Rubrobacter sp.]